MPRPGGFKGGPKAKNAKGTLLRLFKFLFKYYKTYLIIVAVCILLSALAGTVSSLFLNQLLLVIGDGINTGFNSVSGRLMQVIGLMIGFYALGVITTFIYSQLMAVVTQGFLDKMRQNMFGSMQSLPIKYFDTHTHGDIMSYYTNDIDTLRQLISQSILAFLFSRARDLNSSRADRRQRRKQGGEAGAALQFFKALSGAAEKLASATRRRRSRASNQPSGLLLSPRVPIFRNVNSW